MITDNDKIIFFGDSITQAGVKRKGYVTLFSAEIKKQLPDKNIEVIGAGINGNRVPDLQRRLEKDVLNRKPNLVVIYIGINDVWHSGMGNGTSEEDFESGLRDIIKKVQEVDSKVILCTPSVIGEKSNGTNEFDSMLDQYSDISRAVAADTGSKLLDLRKAFTEELRKTNPTSYSAGVLTSDGVHLNNEGNQFVARQMLAAIGMSK